MDLDESSSSGSSLLEPIQSLAGTTVNSPTVSYMTMPTNEEERSAHTASEGQIDLGVIIQEVNGSWDKLRSLLVQKLPNGCLIATYSQVVFAGIASCFQSNQVKGMG